MLDQKGTELNVYVRDHEGLKAAATAGADSVTIGYFSSASYYGLDELEYSIAYAKVLGRKVYVSFSGQVLNSDLDRVLKDIANCISLNCDGILVSDIALAKAVARKNPELRVMISSNLTNSDSMNQVGDACMIVLPKELSREEIFRIRKKVDKGLMLKVFGSQCFAYEGECLFPGSKGKRCSRQCLKAMKKNNPWRTKDLCLLERIPEIVKAGLDAVCVDAYHLSSSHALEAVRIFRDALDERLKKDDVEKISLLTKNGFTEGFYSKSRSAIQRSKGIFLGTVEDGKLVLKDTLQKGEKIAFRDGYKTRIYKVSYMIKDGGKVQHGSAGDTIMINYEFFRNGVEIYKISLADQEFENLRLDMDMKLKLRIGAPAQLSLKAAGVDVKAAGEKDVEAANKTPLEKDIVQSNLGRLSNTPFRLKSLEFDMDDGAVIAYSEINRLKRTALRKLFESFLGRKDIQRLEPDKLPSRKSNSKPSVCVLVHDYEGVEEACSAGADLIYYDIFSHDVSEAMDYAKGCGIPIYLVTPRIIHESEIEHIKKLIEHYSPEGILVADIGLLSPKIKANKHLYTNLCLSNDLVLRYWDWPAVLPVGMDISELLDFNYSKAMVYAHGKAVLMTSKNEIKKNELNVKGKRYSVKRNPYGSTEIIETRVTSLLDYVPQLSQAGVSGFFLDLDDNVRRTIESFKQALES